MLQRTALGLVLAALTAGGVIAQGARLNAAEARSELFVVELSGIVEGADDRWRECIEASGRTVYERGGQRLEGRLEITSDGQACFTYRGDGFSSCFNVLREGGGNYRFDQFVTRDVRRGVTQCSGAEDLTV